VVVPIVTLAFWGDEFGWTGYCPGSPRRAALSAGLIAVWHYPLGSAQFSVHTRASTSTHPATTQTWSRSTARFGEPESSAESSTNTDERPELVSKATVHWP
jgi:hypothetical protein